MLPDTFSPFVGQLLRASISRSVLRLMLMSRVIAREFSPLELRKVAVVPRSTCSHYHITDYIGWGKK